ncbi:MAG: pyruvate formate lyase-activating protein [Lentisphaeria bacterium]|nr:pyruvate formate lyase-activating protein [Lentisphaeria bacterium]
MSFAEVKGRIHSFESFGTLDGPGIRFVVFLQGCFLRCKYCHNPDSWAINGGTEMSVGEIVAKIESCRNFLRNGGVTLSGGEPLLQSEFTHALIEECHKANFHVAIDTAGSVPLEKSKKVLDSADLILLDIKSLDNELCKNLTAFGNENELATLDYCEAINRDVWIRHVLVPEFTLQKERLEELAEFLSHYSCVKRIDLLPLHKMGEYKWRELGLRNELANINEPAAAEIEMAEKIIRSYRK